MKVPFLFAQFIPKEFQPLLSAVSPVAFSVVEWRQVLKQAPLLIRRISEKSGVEDLKNSLDSYWPPKGSSNLGDAVLKLYFAQIFNSKGLFLDLRRRHFVIDDNQNVTFSPNGFWVQWEEPFREGLLNIYEGYYQNQPEKVDNGLVQIGLVTRDMDAQEKAEVKNMLLSHIGSDSQQQKFLISDFTASFERFFQFLLEKKIRLSADFLYLGIYLASLYHCLQEEGGSYDVRGCFQNAASRNLLSMRTQRRI